MTFPGLLFCTIWTILLIFIIFGWLVYLYTNYQTVLLLLLFSTILIVISTPIITLNDGFKGKQENMVALK